MEPVAYSPQQTAIVKIQVRPITEQLKVFVSSSSNGFQEFHGYRLPTVNLR